MGVTQSSINVKEHIYNAKIEPEFFTQFIDLSRNKDPFYKDCITFHFIKSLYNSQPAKVNQILDYCVDQLNGILFEKKEIKNAIPIVRIFTRILGQSHINYQLHEFLWEGFNSNARKSLAEQIVRLLTDLLFFPGVCVPLRFSFDEEKTDLLWKVSSDTSITRSGTTSNYFYDRNRKEILDCLLVCFSKEIYSDKKSDPSYKITDDEICFMQDRDLWVETFIDPVRNPMCRTLFYSLVNTISSYPEHKRLLINYNYSGLYSSAIQIFIKMIDYKLMTVNELESRFNFKEGVIFDVPKASDIKHFKNLFRECFLEKSFGMFFKDLFSAFELMMSSVNLKDPFHKDNELMSEVLLFLWKIVNQSEDFLKFFLDQNHHKMILLLIRILIFVSYRKIKDPAEELNLVLLILLKLSEKRKFSVLLNSQYRDRLYSIKDFRPYEGWTFFDILVSISTGLTARSANLDRTYDSNCIFVSLFGIMANVSPFISSLGLESSVALIRIFERVSRLYHSSLGKTLNSVHRDYIQSLLDIFNNFLQYQYKGCSYLVYEIILKKNLFLKLFDLDMKIDQNINEKELLKKFLKNEIERSLRKKIKNTFVKNDKDLNGNKEDFEEKKEENSSIRLKKFEEKSVGNLSFIEKEKSYWRGNGMLKTIKKLVDFIGPQIEAFCQKDSDFDEKCVFSFIKNETLVGILPLPHQINIKKFKKSLAIINWEERFLWKMVLANSEENELFDIDELKMFHIIKINPDP